MTNHKPLFYSRVGGYMIPTTTTDVLPASTCGLWLLPTVQGHAFGERQRLEWLKTDLRCEWLLISRLALQWACVLCRVYPASYPKAAVLGSSTLQRIKREIMDGNQIQMLKFHFYTAGKWHRELWRRAAEAVNKAECISCDSRKRTKGWLWEKPENDRKVEHAQSEAWRLISSSTESADSDEVSMAC